MNLEPEHFGSGALGVVVGLVVREIGRFGVNLWRTNRIENREDFNKTRELERKEEVTAILGFQRLVVALQSDIDELRDEIIILKNENKQCQKENAELRKRVANLENKSQ